jgi:hypothetical protein
MGVGARSQSERGGGMGSKAADRQAGRQACEGKQAALDTDEQSALRGGNKRKWRKKRKQRAGHKRRGKKARDLRSWSSLLFIPLPDCLPACLLLSIGVLLKSPLFVSSFKKKKKRNSIYLPIFSPSSPSSQPSKLIS